MYCIDTSALLDGWIRYYPPENFPGLWERLDKLMVAGELVSSRQVMFELEKKQDDLYQWAREREDFFIEIDDVVQDRVIEIMATYPRLVGSHVGISSADPFVIALAQTHDSPMTVVSGENFGSKTRPRIPDVCRAEKIRCIKLVELIVERSWVF